MGDEEPKPGKGVFQVRFSLSLQVTGGVELAMPSPLGPRKRGQSAENKELVSIRIATKTKMEKYFIDLNLAKLIDAGTHNSQAANDSDHYPPIFPRFLACQLTFGTKFFD